MDLSYHEDADQDTNYNENSDYSNFYNYSVYYDIESFSPLHPSPCTDVMCVLLAIAYAIICILGIIGNGLVIWIAGFKLNKSINCMWYLSLAVSDILFCTNLPFLIVNLVMKSWILGSFMCKFTYFILVLNMYSSIFLLVIISMDRCVVVIFPVWAQNNRTIKKCSVVIMLTWILAIALSIHPTKAREVHSQICTYNTGVDEQKALMGIKFVFGFAVPVLMIICCYISIMLKLGANRMTTSTKPFKVMTLLIVLFIVCWLPHHIINFVELIGKNNDIVNKIQPYSTVLASSNSCMNPLLYALMGKDPKKKFYNIRYKIKNAFEEEGQSSMCGTVNTNLVGLSTTG